MEENEEKLKQKLEKALDKLPEDLKKEIEEILEERSFGIAGVAQKYINEIREDIEIEFEPAEVLLLLNKKKGEEELRSLCRKCIDYQNVADILGSLDFQEYQRNFPSFDDRKQSS